MSDIIDRISEGRKITCPDCGEVFEDINPEVAIAICNNHRRRRHG